MTEPLGWFSHSWIARVAGSEWKIVISTSAIMLFLVLILTLWLSSLITLPLKEMMAKFARGSTGDLSVRMDV